MNHANKTLVLFLTTLVIASSLPQQSIATQNHHHHSNNHHHKHKAKAKANAKSSLINTACQNARSKDSCVLALQSDPNAPASDLKGLALIALKLASTNASDAADYMKGLVGDESLDPAVQDGASECLDHYLDAAEQLEDSVAALLADAPQDVKTWLDVAVTDADSCDSALGVHAKAVMGGKSDAFHDLCAYALAVTELLAHEKHFD